MFYSDTEDQIRTPHGQQPSNAPFGNTGVSSTFILSSSTASPATTTTYSPSPCDPPKPSSSALDLPSRSSSSALPLSEEECIGGPFQNWSDGNHPTRSGSDGTNPEETTSYVSYINPISSFVQPNNSTEKLDGRGTCFGVKKSDRRVWSGNITSVSVETVDNDVSTQRISAQTEALSVATYSQMPIKGISSSNSQTGSQRYRSDYRSLGSPREVESSSSVQPSHITSTAVHPALQSRYHQANSTTIHSQAGCSGSIVTEYRESRLSLLEARYKYARQQGHELDYSPLLTQSRDNPSLTEYTQNKDYDRSHSYSYIPPRSAVGTSRHSGAPYLNREHQLVRPNRSVAIPRSERPAQAAARARDLKRHSGSSDAETLQVKEEAHGGVADIGRRTPQRTGSEAKRSLTPTGRKGSATPKRMSSTSLSSPGKTTQNRTSSRSLADSMHSDGSNPHYMMDKQGKFHVLEPSEIPAGCPLSPLYTGERRLSRSLCGPPRCAGDIPQRYLHGAEENRNRREKNNTRVSCAQQTTNIGRLPRSTSKAHESYCEGSIQMTERKRLVETSEFMTSGARQRATSCGVKGKGRATPTPSKRASSVPTFRWPFGGAPPRPPSDLEKERNRRLRSRSSTKRAVRPELAAPATRTYRLRLLFDLSPPSFDDDDRSGDSGNEKLLKHRYR